MNKNASFDNNTCQYAVFSSSQRKIINFFFRATIIGVFAALLGMLLYYVYAFAALSNGMRSFDWLLGIFSDFVTIMNASLMDNPYTLGGASYPPLAIAVLFPFAFICKGVFAQYAHLDISVDELTSKVILHPEFWISLVLFFTICTSVIIFVISKILSLDLKLTVKMGTIMILSAPFVFAIMRGNTIYFALVFLLLFLWLHESNNAFLREISYLCLALAGLIKIYPLFFGIFLLKKKKLFASARVAVYFIIGTFLSFFLYSAGLDNLSLFTENLGNFADDSYHLLSGTNLSITSILYKVFYIFSPSSTETLFFNVLNLTLIILVFIISAVLGTITNSPLSRAVIASAVIILIPSVSYFYVLVFTIIPFMEFIKNYDNMTKKKRILYTVIFFFLFFTLSILPKNFLLHTIAISILLVTELKTVILTELIPFFKSRKRNIPQQ